MFTNENFINVKSPLEKNDHPELDISELCNEEQSTKYMSMTGQLQWAITLGRYETGRVYVQIQTSTQSWTLGKNEKIIGISCEDQTLWHQIKDQRT